MTYSDPTKTWDVLLQDALSEPVKLGGYTLIRIHTPATWATANLTFQMSEDGDTWNNLYDDAGTEYTVTASTSRAIILNPSDFAGVRYLKVRSGTSGTPVPQDGAVVTLVGRGLT